MNIGVVAQTAASKPATARAVAVTVVDTPRKDAGMIVLSVCGFTVTSTKRASAASVVTKLLSMAEASLAGRLLRKRTLDVVIEAGLATANRCWLTTMLAIAALARVM